jgi:hypothetical protein
MADDRTYIRVHDGMPDHPKIDGLSDAAFRALVTHWCWCSRHLTDGVVPLATWLKRTPAKVRNELVAAGLVELTPEAALMHDYLEHQRSAADVAEIRAARVAAGQKANHERWHVQKGIREPSCPLCYEAPPGIPSGSDLGSDPESDRASEPDPIRSPETETEEELQLLPSPPAARKPQPGSDADPEFAAFWSVYPRKVGKRDAQKAWRSALRRGADPRTITAAAERYRNDPRRKSAGDEYTAHPTTWLNGDRYDDAPPQAQAGGGWWNN